MTRIGSYGASVDLAWDDAESVHKVALLVWDSNALAWVKYGGAAGGAGGVGDASAANQVLELAKLASIDGKLGSLSQKTMVGSAPVVLASDQSAIPITDNAGSLTVDGTVGISGTVPVSAAALPLPSGAATSAKQPSLGTAGTASADVISVQGIASMTALKVDGSAVTQPISGTTTANIGTTNGLALDATLTGGSLQAKITDGTNVATVKAASIAAAATDKALVVAVSPNNSVAVTGTFFQATQPISGTVTANAGTGNFATNLAQVNGSTVTASATGVQKVGVSGATAITLDGADNAAAPTNGLMNLGIFSTTVPALTSGNAAQLRVDSTGALSVNFEGRKQTFSCAVLDFAALSSATAPSFSITGSATKTVRILKVGISATAATGGIATLNLRRFSALSGGTAASQSANIAKHDTNNAAATAVVNTWSVVATTATSAGIVRSLRFEFPTPAVTVQPVLYEWVFGSDAGQGLVLRGTSDFVGLCFNGIGTTPATELYVEWTEE